MDTLLRQFSIRQRLLGSMVLLSVLIVVLGLWSSAALKGSQARSEQLLSEQSRQAATSQELNTTLERVQRLEQMVLLTSGNAVEAADHLTAWQKQTARAQELLAALPEAARQGPMAEGLAGFNAYRREVQPVLQQVVDAKMDGNTGFAYTNQQAAELQKARDQFAVWQTQAQEAQQLAQAEAKATEARQSLFRLVTVCVMLLLFIGLMWQTAQSITRPVDTAIAIADRIASGDLSRPVVAQGRDEIARLVTALNRMQDALKDVVGRVRHSADSIRTASDEVATGNLDLSQRTEQAASNLQQTAASMEQLTGTVHHSASSAAQARELAASASGVAQRGGAAVGQVVQTMEAIQQASRKIADITGVIDGIAFQTNILALNAAVEAARAGEQGRGFAVVAGEVRTLAQRSAEAAREIKGLIQASVEQVGSGTAQVAAAGETMNEILGSVRRVDDIIQEIASASGEQSKGIGEIGSAVHALDQMTQQNAALVEESAAAAESLKTQARSLTEVVATFRLAAHDDSPARSA